ncbi:Glycosyltransferase family 10 (fucosyltransferase) C-term [Marisediminitalea aggregata]|uniref:Glycosyltransferase family 10 (Fucosyltransferase) C-term n=1 Tax=Marisediminitalea aggregata TaxID=634436 RepID=A0A1M5SXL4_9ALTE|nr:glycosyltransferase family 10 [Marisediminitalea aggregata]SHH43242.1 Glycosyltransferase family 10 (fucosyltransferase) C-term [Marisediminitalea aggregata]
MGKKTNVVLLGTSNSIKAGSYYKELSNSSNIKIVCDVRVGDVPSAYFLSADKKLAYALMLSDVQYIIIDSMINDVLMTESGVLDLAYIKNSFSNLAELFKSNSNKLPQIILFNICPKAVEFAKVYTDVKIARKSSLLSAGFKVKEIDILYSRSPDFFEESDPLHHSEKCSKAICHQLYASMVDVKREPTLESSFIKYRLQKNYVDLGNLPELKTTGHAGYFESSLTTQPVCIVGKGEELTINFDNAAQLLGLKFIASENAAAVIRMKLGKSTFYIPGSSKYPKPIIRYCPFPQVVYSQECTQVSLSVVASNEIEDKEALLKLPNAKLEESGVNDRFSVSICGLVTDRQEINYRKSVSFVKSSPTLKVAFECFWPGYNPKNDPIFGTLLQRNFNVVYCEDVESADIVIVSWYSPDKSRTARYKELKQSIEGKLIYYSAEHDGAGLEGQGQLDFNIFDHIFSHYVVDNDKHTWLPNYARRHGVNVFSTVNRLYKKNISKKKNGNIQFCYSNDACVFRNELFKALKSGTSVDANGSLFNTTGIKLPREHDKYIEALSEYKFVIACENSSAPGYNTEKIVHALMAGSVPLYWGDPLIGSIWNEDCFINLNQIDMDSCVEAVIQRGDSIYEHFKEKGAIPFPEAEKMERELEGSIFEAFNKLSAS